MGSGLENKTFEEWAVMIWRGYLRSCRDFSSIVMWWSSPHSKNRQQSVLASIEVGAWGRPSRFVGRGGYVDDNCHGLIMMFRGNAHSASYKILSIMTGTHQKFDISRRYVVLAHAPYNCMYFFFRGKRACSV